ncbi:MAG: hypothetical protein A2X36_00495 [Elusimicrobia bacterium GWA2_69_24]|nr:MAG: hypothetical protein A2X36_00495 [Elusimicrobia bacterium GWA2_69_24]HBL16450.1 hypothetical protein [Elusimicrobiota bacterium]
MPGKILIVEDDADYRELIGRVLEKAGYSVTSAPNGEEGLRRYAADAPDLVILDGQLPDIDGFEVCRRIRSQGPRPDTPILFCTVRSAVSPVAEGLRSGGTDYILKPFEIADLLQRVRSALASAK